MSCVSRGSRWTNTACPPMTMNGRSRRLNACAMRPSVAAKSGFSAKAIEHAGQLERPEITIPNIHDPAVQRASTKFLHEVNVAREHQLAKEGKLGGRTVEDVDERARRFGKILEGRED